MEIVMVRYYVLRVNILGSKLVFFYEGVAAVILSCI